MASNKAEIMKREVESLLYASKKLGCKKLGVITWDYEGTDSISGQKIWFTPLWKYLLSGQSTSA